MKKKYAIMGKLVTVTQIYKRWQKANASENNFCVTWVKETIERRVGWIVGWRNVYNGMLTWNGNSYSFKQGEAVPHVLISFYPTLKPVRVPIEACSGFHTSALEPYCKSKQEREMSKECAVGHRGKDGRFI